MREIHDILVESAKLAATDGDNTPRALAERSKHLYDLAHDMLEKERRRGPDRIAIDAYLHYVDDLWERAKPFYGGAKPGARISDEERGDALAWVKSSDHDNVDYTRRLARDFMDDPAGIPGSVFEYVRPLASSRQAHHASQAALRRNVKATKRHGRAQAKSVPLHEWAHVKQFRSGTFPDLEQWEYEGGAEALAQMLEGSVAGVKTGRVYGPYVRRVNRERGPEWVTHGQFGEVAPARSLASVADEHGLRPLVTQKFVRRKKYKKRIG
jgi:hypothetical protein